MSEQLSGGYPGEKFSKSREASREAERSRLLAAKEQYDSLSPELQDKIDGFTDAVTNVTLEKAESELGDSWYGGSDFNKKLARAIKNFATGYSRDNESLQKAFNSSVGDRRVAEIAFETASSYIDSFPELKELEYHTKPPAIDTISVDVNLIDQVDVMPENINSAAQDDSNEALILEKELPTSSLEKTINWLKSVMIDSKQDVETAVDEYLTRYPNNTRAQAVGMVFENSDISPDIREAEKQETLKAVIIDNFSNSPIISKDELLRIIAHHEYKYGEDLESVDLNRHDIKKLIISHGKFTPEFTKTDAIKALM
jgi:hypothetical protein